MGGLAGWLGGLTGWLGGLAGWLGGLAGWLGGLVGGVGWTDGRKEGWTGNLPFYRTLSPFGAAAQKGEGEGEPVP